MGSSQGDVEVLESTQVPKTSISYALEGCFIQVTYVLYKIWANMFLVWNAANASANCAIHPVSVNVIVLQLLPLFPTAVLQVSGWDIGRLLMISRITYGLHRITSAGAAGHQRHHESLPSDSESRSHWVSAQCSIELMNLRNIQVVPWAWRMFDRIYLQIEECCRHRYIW